jgi:hypothetical protein
MLDAINKGGKAMATTTETEALTLMPKPDCYWDICKTVDDFIKTHPAAEALYLIELFRETLDHFEEDLRARQAMN